MIINFKNLPKDLYKKIPLSIRSKVNSIDLNELPVEVAFELKNYKEVEKSDLVIDEKVYDVKAEISIYNDFEYLTTKKQTIIEYIKNYILVRKGTYPFDPSFGNEFYKYLQLLDKSVVQIMISNEFEELKRVILSIFKTSIDISNFSTSKINQGVFVEYQMNISVTVEKEIFNLSANI
jgi:hypothetical protein